MKRLLLILPAILLLSCSVQKRKYQGGYYVNWHSKHPKTTDKAVTSTKAADQKKIKEVRLAEKEQANTETFASAENTIPPSTVKKTIKHSFALSEDSCDVLVYKDGAEIKGKIIEKTENEIKYKRCDTPDGPTYISKKSELFMIKYSNGTREVVKAEEQPRQVLHPTREPRNTGNGTDQKQVHPLAIAALVFGVVAVCTAYAGAILTVVAAEFAILFLFSLAAAIIAFVSGKMALSRIREQRDLYKGKGAATTGLIMGIIMLGIYAIIASFTLLVFALGI